MSDRLLKKVITNFSPCTTLQLVLDNTEYEFKCPLHINFLSSGKKRILFLSETMLNNDDGVVKTLKYVYLSIKSLQFKYVNSESIFIHYIKC